MVCCHSLCKQEPPVTAGGFPGQLNSSTLQAVSHLGTIRGKNSSPGCLKTSTAIFQEDHKGSHIEACSMSVRGWDKTPEKGVEHSAHIHALHGKGDNTVQKHTLMALG